MQGGHSKAAAYRALISAVIGRAIDDLKGDGPPCSQKEMDKAMSFVLSEDCEAFCLELDIDYEALKEKASTLYRRFLDRDFPGP
jgi:hypothetical protein